MIVYIKYNVMVSGIWYIYVQYLVSDCVHKVHGIWYLVHMYYEVYIKYMVSGTYVRTYVL